MADPSSSCCGGGSCDPGPDRREFLRTATVAAFGSLRPPPAHERPGQGQHQEQGQEPDHHVPADKQLSPQWLASLQSNERTVWRGEALRTIAMPCGGVAAGQLGVTGDGRLCDWWIGNDACHTSWGGQHSIDTEAGPRDVGYATFAPAQPVEHGAVLAIHRPRGGPQVLPLDRATFPATTFLGEYPVATIDYAREHDPPQVVVRAEAFSPFVPLSARDSALPATLLRYTLRNDSALPLTVTLASWLQNPVLHEQRGAAGAELRNVAVHTDALAAVVMEAVALPTAPAAVTFADFEDGYAGWQVQDGDAFGDAPATGALAHQQEVTGFHGQRLVDTFRDGDKSTGTLVSPEFKIELPYIAFRIGGGRDRERLGLALQVREQEAWQTVRSATGSNREALATQLWRVDELRGRSARLLIRDASTRAWGHVNVDWIRFCALPPDDAAFQQTEPQAGTVALAALDASAVATAGADDVPALLAQVLPGDAGREPTGLRPVARGGLDRPPRGGVACTATLKAGEVRTFTFAVTWHFPHRRQRDDEWLQAGDVCGNDGPRVGNMYANWFPSALAVAQHLAEHGERLAAATLLFRDTLYRDTTLPHWFVQRAAAPLSTLATATLQWREDGRVWAWEGVGCCPGTCGHVWNYAQGMAWLFPELERSVRERQDFARGLGLKDSGAVGFRGTADANWAGDAQGGYVLKAYREHRLSGDPDFLRRVWPAVQQVLQFLLQQDGAEPDGLLEGRQHNTYDIDFVGANTMVGSLYLAALRAGARMAKAMGDAAFAQRCEQLAQRGSELSMQRLWNGEYFVQELPAAQRDAKFQYGDGCLSDQLLGQWFADQLDLGYLYPRDAVRTALQSIWRCNWAPDVGPQAAAHKPERAFAAAGEPGLFTCTWPKSRHRGDQGVRYRDEVWTGIEYQVAAHLLREGFTTEGLSIVRGVHERYAPGKHNPYNEIECGDHYARALASWSCLLAVTGLECDVSTGLLAFAPRLSPADFRGPFVAGTGWGTFTQRRFRGEGEREVQTQTIVLRGGRFTLQTLRCEVPAGRQVQGAQHRRFVGNEAKSAPVPFVQDGTRVEVRFEPPLPIEPVAAGSDLVQFEFGKGGG